MFRPRWRRCATKLTMQGNVIVGRHLDCRHIILHPSHYRPHLVKFTLSNSLILSNTWQGT